MTRPKKCRWIDRMPVALHFKPAGIPLRSLEEVSLTLDEAEALRIADLEGNYHELGGEVMGVSRATFGRILESARHKVADVILTGKALRIEGGVIRMTDVRTFICNDCGNTWQEPYGTGYPDGCPQCRSANIVRSEGAAAPGPAGGAFAGGGRGVGSGPGGGAGPGRGLGSGGGKRRGRGRARGGGRGRGGGLGGM
jgi:predicted DNA-binding protein (UPF0251 family)